MFSTRLAVISALLALAVGCSGYSPPTPPTSPSPSPSPSPAPTADSGSSVVIPVGAEFLEDRAFVPDSLDVSVGTTVTWINSDSTSHTSTSDVTAWNSGTLPPGGRFSFAFQTAGTFRYHCAIHPGMVGTISVR